jgi:hypothetical protein
LTKHGQRYDVKHAIADGSFVTTQSEDFVMNTRNYGIGKTTEQADSADSQRDQASFVVELGTVTNETKTDFLAVTIDSFPRMGSFGS